MSLERELSEELIYSITKNDLDDVNKSWFNYIFHVFNELKEYDKRLFTLNYRCYTEYIIENHKPQ